MQDQRTTFLLLGTLGLLLGIFLYLNWKPSGPTPEELAESALAGASIEERTAAAVRLSNYGPEALESLRRVVGASNDPEVKCACVMGLAGLWDYDSMDLFFSLLETEGTLVSNRAAQAVMRMTGRQRRFSAGLRDSERKTLIKHMRDDWAEIASASQEDRDELINRLKASHETQ